MTFITLMRVFKPIEASLLAARLQAAGFHAEVVGDLSSSYSEGGPLTNGGVGVQVPAEEAEEARVFLQNSESVPS